MSNLDELKYNFEYGLIITNDLLQNKDKIINSFEQLNKELNNKSLFCYKIKELFLFLENDYIDNLQNLLE
jgi:hypothetical protein